VTLSHAQVPKREVLARGPILFRLGNLLLWLTLEESGNNHSLQESLGNSNKMDDPTVKWNKARFDEMKGPFAKVTGYNPKTDLFFIPVSACTGVNVKERADKQTAPWYK
jgi:hypothetical protein